MSLLGKLLIVFNLLAAGSFAYFATQDWKGRQTISAVGVRYKLYLSGLPFEGPDRFDGEDETPFRIELAGSTPTETVSKKILEIYFQSAPKAELSEPGPVPCQIAEIKRVKAKLGTLLKDKGPAEQLEMLKAWLLDQCENYEQRQEVLDAKDPGVLEAKLMGMFDAVLAPPVPTVDAAGTKAVAEVPAELEKKWQDVWESRLKPLDPTERQYKAAQLLAFLKMDDADWQKRVMIVVGLRKYVAAIGVRAFRYRDMAERMRKLIVADQAGYLAAEQNLNRLARSRTELANKAAKLKLEKIEEAKKADEFVEIRKTQLATIQNQLIKIKSEVDELLFKQGKIESNLFDVQREVAVTLDEVYRLEAQLEARENELLKPKK